jgi:undecaprenyl diphosphate synthase
LGFTSSLKASIEIPTIKELQKKNIPAHVAIIMDGNGRWAKKRKLPRIAGHRAGVKALINIVEVCIELGLKFLTVYSFSIENWQRPQEEVKGLMRLFRRAMREQLDALSKNGVKLKLLGSEESVPPEVFKSFKDAEYKTKDNKNLTLNIAFNYGSRQEIVNAVKRICDNVKKNKLKVEELDENILSSFLYTGKIPDPDLLIRTGGELRASNFLLWQIAYTELYFTKTLWPDFSRKQFLGAIYNYQQRNRRFGKL